MELFSSGFNLFCNIIQLPFIKLYHLCLIALNNEQSIKTNVDHDSIWPKTSVKIPILSMAQGCITRRKNDI